MTSALTTADALIGLDYRLDGTRHTPFLDAVKQRGGALLPGLHPYTLDAEGIHVFPRLEALPPPSVVLPIALISRARVWYTSGRGVHPPRRCESLAGYAATVP